MAVITLYQSLFETFPGYGDDHAGAKLHVVEAVSSGLPAEFSITDTRTHESTQFSTGSWVENALLLFDQAYFDYRTIDLIDANGGWFLTRLEPNANPETTGELRRWRDDAISLEGEQVRDILDDLHRDVINVDGEVEFKRRVYDGTRSRAFETFHVVGVWNDEEDRYTSTSRICPQRTIARLISRSSVRRAGRWSFYFVNSGPRTDLTRSIRENRRLWKR